MEPCGRSRPCETGSRNHVASGRSGGWHTGGAMTALPLVFDAPRRALPPRHLADLDPADRRSAVRELGLPGFRADQLARHYFGRLTADVTAMTDVPAAARDGLATLLPPLVTPVTEQACDGGTT